MYSQDFAGEPCANSKRMMIIDAERKYLCSETVFRLSHLFQHLLRLWNDAPKTLLRTILMKHNMKASLGVSMLETSQLTFVHSA
jgi:hypothetical protein